MDLEKVLEEGQDFFLEEIAISRRATDIIRKAKHMLLLHHLRTRPEQAPDPSPSRREPSIAASIDADLLKALIRHKLEEEQLYLNEDLTIAAFAHELDIEPYQLSRFLNIHLDTTYTRLINSYRIREAKELLGRSPGDTILNIAFSSGFNSKASFNRIFKRLTGMTPSEYRMRILADKHTAAVKSHS